MEDNVYQMIVDELVERKALHVKKFGSLYACAIGCHMMNIVQKKKKIFYLSGTVRDFRMHPFMVCPSGWGKTYWTELFLDKDVGILKDTVIPHIFQSYITEAGWSGTVKMINGIKFEQLGLAHEYMTGVVGFEEFQAVISALQTTHSKHLDTALLDSLDKGRVRKTLSAGMLSYETYVTMFGGTQTTRLYLTGGMGRRFLFLVFFPTKRDKILLRKWRRLGHNVRPNPVRSKAISKAIDRKWKQIKNVNWIQWEPSTFRVLDKYGLTHFQEDIYERIMLGYHLMSKPVTSEVKIEADKEMARLVDLEYKHRHQIMRGGQVSLVLQCIEDAGGTISLFKLRNILLDFQLDWTESSEIIDRLRRSKIISMTSTGQVKMQYGKS